MKPQSGYPADEAMMASAIRSTNVIKQAIASQEPADL